MNRSILLSLLLLIPWTLAACSTAPRDADQDSFRAEAMAAERWFVRNVPGLKSQLAQSAGYVVFPSVGQWGIIFSGGQFGRGLVNNAEGEQIGWGAINTGSIGLQAGVRGYKLLVVFQDRATLDRFKLNQLSGSATGVVVAAESGAAQTAPFQGGVALYQGASTGLIAGINIGLEYMRFQPIDAGR